MRVRIDRTMSRADGLCQGCTNFISIDLNSRANVRGTFVSRFVECVAADVRVDFDFYRYHEHPHTPRHRHSSLSHSHMRDRG